MNAARRLQVSLGGELVVWVDVVAQMDDKLARSLEHLYPCTEQQFTDAYSALHQEVHGEPFTVK
ncbi:MAG: hypothetical protein ACRC8R_12015 [Aeromonas hydrophila]